MVSANLLPSMEPGQTWQLVGPGRWELAWPDRTVHVWRATFHDWQLQATRLTSNLSEEERRRMRRFRDPDLAARYAIGRGLLRELLGKYAGASPASLEISTNAYGKPEPVAAAGAIFHFNLAHTDEIVLYGFTGLRPIGVDVEGVAPGPPDPLEARRILSDEEWTVWETIPDDERNALFSQTWVRKEAVLKALGVGLSIEPDTFAVGFAPQVEVVRVRKIEVCLCDLLLNTSVKAAIALTDEKMPQISCFTAVPA